MRHLPLTALIALSALLAPAASAQVPMQISPPPYPVQTPQPWLPPTYQSPRGSTEHVVIPPPAPTPQPRAGVPPPLYVPQTGRLLPNLPTPAPSGPHGTETYQDRAARCAHQAGVYGQVAGNRAGYIGSCINQ
jgi:hypothetical protein